MKKLIITVLIILVISGVAGYSLYSSQMKKAEETISLIQENKMQEALMKCEEFSLTFFKDRCYTIYVSTFLGRKISAIKKENLQPTDEEYQEMDSTIDFFCAKVQNKKINQKCVEYKQSIRQMGSY